MSNLYPISETIMMCSQKSVKMHLCMLQKTAEGFMLSQQWVSTKNTRNSRLPYGLLQNLRKPKSGTRKKDADAPVVGDGYDETFFHIILQRVL